MRMFLLFWGMVSFFFLFFSSLFLVSTLRLFRTSCGISRTDCLLIGFDTREFDGRDITNYLGLLEEGKDEQPQYGEELLNKLAGWAIGK